LHARSFLLKQAYQNNLIKDEYFDKLLQGYEKAAWHSFKFAVKGFLGN
jgi:hypothetical protein